MSAAMLSRLLAATGAAMRSAAKAVAVRSMLADASIVRCSSTPTLTHQHVSDSIVLKTLFKYD